MQREEYDMEMLKLRLKMLREFWERLLRQGVLVTTLMLAVAGLGWAVVYLHNDCKAQRKEDRLEWKAEVAEARNEARVCAMARKEETDELRRQIYALRETVERMVRRKK